MQSKPSITSKLNIIGNNVLLIGNWGYKNLGDELILLGNVKLLLKQGKKITIACYNTERLRNFFSQFIDVDKISFIQELPKGFHSLYNYIFKYGMKGFLKFLKCDTIILGGGEILTEENPGAYWYRKMSIWPFLRKKGFNNRLKISKKTNLYIMGGIQVPKDSHKKRNLLSLLKHTTACYLRDFQAIEEIKLYIKKCEFFMDTSYFAYDWNNISIDTEKKIEKPYIVVNLNKNAEQFFDELITDIKIYCKKGYRIYYVPIAKGDNTYYHDLQYSQRLEKALGEDADFALLDWESNFYKFSQILKGAKKVFSSRLHLYLISSFLGCDTKVYPYQRKILKMKEVIDSVLKN